MPEMVEENTRIVRAGARGVVMLGRNGALISVTSRPRCMQLDAPVEARIARAAQEEDSTWPTRHGDSATRIGRGLRCRRGFTTGTR